MSKPIIGAAPTQQCASNTGGFARWHELDSVAALIRDELLPQLLPRLRAPVTGPAAAAMRCTLVDARYQRFLKAASHTKATFTAAYRCESTAGHVTWIGVRAFRDGRSATFHRASGARDIGLVHLPESDAVAWVLPAEPNLPRLNELLASSGAVPGLATTRAASPDAAARTQCTVVRYRPLQRCAVELSRRACDQPGREQACPVAFGKIFADERGRRTFEHLIALARACQSRLADVLVPSALGYDADRNALWLAHFDGAPIDDIAAVVANPALIERLGRAVAMLHDQRLWAPPAPSLDQLVRDARKKAAKIASEHPEAAPTLIAAVELAAATSPQLPWSAPACIHGDLHLGQWLRRGDALMLADFDEIAVGDPALDIANFGVDLAMRGMDLRTVDMVIDQLTGAYRGAGGPRVCVTRLRWHALIHWINRAYRVFLQQRPGLDRALHDTLLKLSAAMRALRSSPLRAEASA